MALSHHPMVLKLADLVRVERSGQYPVYAPHTAVFRDLLTAILNWLGIMDGAEASTVPGAGEEHTQDDASQAWKSRGAHRWTRQSDVIWERTHRLSFVAPLRAAFRAGLR